MMNFLVSVPLEYLNCKPFNEDPFGTSNLYDLNFLLPNIVLVVVILSIALSLNGIVVRFRVCIISALPSFVSSFLVKLMNL